MKFKRSISWLHSTSLLLFISCLAFVLTACGLLAPGAPGPAAPCSVQRSKQAADRLLQRINAANKTPGAAVTITATSEEVTSLLNEYFDQAKSTNPNMEFPLQDPIVCFRNGKMVLYGRMATMGVNASALITIAAAINNGKADFRVEKVELGPLSVPSGLGDLISSLLTNALNENMGQIQLTRLVIQGEQITLTGRVR